MNKEITLSKKYGVNPSIEKCSWCGKDTGAILMVGLIHKWLCHDCCGYIYSRTAKNGCPKCGSKSGRMKKLEHDVEAPRTSSIGNLCDDCQKKKEESEAVVKEGGIYWRCKDCGSTGAIKKDAALAVELRRKYNVQAPTPIGVEFTKENLCPVCGPNKIEPTKPVTGEHPPETC